MVYFSVIILTSCTITKMKICDKNLNVVSDTRIQAALLIVSVVVKEFTFVKILVLTFPCLVEVDVPTLTRQQNFDVTIVRPPLYFVV